MSKLDICTNIQVMKNVSDIKSAIKKCKEDSTCDAVQDFKCGESGPFFNCKQVPKVSGGEYCTYVKGKNSIKYIYIPNYQLRILMLLIFPV